MLVGILALGLGVEGGPSFAYSDVAGSSEDWIFLTFILAFLIKCPVWPFHGWVPDAYRAAPPEVAAGLSGLASKAGAYGLIAIVLPIFPGPSADWRWPLIALATTGLLYGSYLAFRQPDSRGVIAYSSIGQMGLIVLGIFVLNDQGATGAAFAMVNHALLSAALFLLAGWVERTVGTGDFRVLGGLARGRPVLATIVHHRGRLRPRGAGLGDVRVGVPDPAGGVPGGLVARRHRVAGHRAGRDVHAALDLGHPARPRGRRRRRAPPARARAGRVPGHHRRSCIAILALSMWPFGLTERVDPTTRC